jgi:hypothetical protein
MPKRIDMHRPHASLMHRAVPIIVPMKLLGVAGLTALGNLLGGLVGAPWQALFAYTFFAAFCTTVVALAQILVPQDSGDRVLWWDKILKSGKAGNSANVGKSRDAGEIS